MHLRRFSAPEVAVFETTGEGRRTRYRFRDPLMRPFVVIKGVRDGALALPGGEGPRDDSW